MTILTFAIAMAIATVSPMSMASTALPVNDGGYEVTKVEVGWNAKSSVSAINKISDDAKVGDIDSSLLTYLGVDYDDLRDLCKVVYGESRGESDLGQQYVVHTIYNRYVNEWGNSIHKVIYAPRQFSAVKADGYGDYTGKEIRNVLRALYNRGQGNIELSHYEILYFCSFDDIRDFERSNRCKNILEIGGHTFFVKKGE